MGLLDRDVGVAVAATAAVFSPRTRSVMRKGAVYGLAGALKAGDVVASTTRGAFRGARQGVSSNGDAPQAAEPAPPPAPEGSSGTPTTAST
jgi:hypothetical protein